MRNIVGNKYYHALDCVVIETYITYSLIIGHYRTLWGPVVTHSAK